MKISNNDLLKMDAVEIYKLILSKKIGKFPNGFWNRPDALESSAKCTRYLIEEYLGMNKGDIKTKVMIDIFRENPINRIEAMRYVFFEKLRFKEEELVEKVSQKLFTEHGLMGMLNKHTLAFPIC